MDLPDIRIVVQWKATCDLCTLWQRFGRAARGAGQEATAILFVEKKDTDEERILKAARAAQRLAKKNDSEAMTGQKRKAGTELTSGSSKRRSTLGECTNNLNNEQISHSCSDSTPLSHEKVTTERREQRRAHYKKRPVAKKTIAKEKKKVNVEVGSPMDDFINAASDHNELIDCRRIVPMLFFENDKRRT
jgi:superfamily II DNA/RNA helicase